MGGGVGGTQVRLVRAIKAYQCPQGPDTLLIQPGVTVVGESCSEWGTQTD